MYLCSAIKQDKNLIIMKNFTNLKILQSQSKAINDAFESIELLRNNSSCDKLGFGFSRDDKYCACSGLTIHVSSHKGFYGNSGCTTIFSLNKDIFNEYLLKVLNKNFTDIMRDVSALISSDAALLKQDALLELNGLIDEINSL